MQKILVIAVSLFLCYACYHKEKRESQPANTVASDSISKLSYPNDSGVVNIPLINGTGKMQIHKNAKQAIYLEFNPEGYKKLHGKLTSQDSLANIRFSQITLPDGTMDGPFGREIEYDAAQNGVYRISVHESLMAGDPWAGDFTVELKLTK